MNGEKEVLNRKVKHILKKIVNSSRKDWAKKLDNELWAYHITFETPLGMTP